MGSANCKEYVTTTKCAAADDNPQNGTTGTYHSKCNMADYTEEVAVCKVDDLQENEMRQVEVQPNMKALLVRQKNNIYAVGNKCTHYGAPLNTGALGDLRVRCPWHGACFDLTTGDIEDFPGLDSLPCFRVNVDTSGQVKLSARRQDVEKNSRLKDMVKRAPDDNRCYVAVGGGPSSGVFVETLRQEGYTGRIVMVCAESYLPYDRVKISKAMNITIDKLEFRKREFYDEHDIEVLSGVSATGLNVQEKTLQCSNGQALKYDKIFVATGMRPNKPNIEGADLKNIFTLKDFDDKEAIMAAVTNETRLVTVGGSFVSMETASFLHDKVKSCTVVGRSEVPFQNLLGWEVGNRFLQLYQEKGVDMRMSSGVTAVLGDDNGAVRAVRLTDGSELPCDLLIFGVGGVYNTNFLRESGVKLNERDGSIDTDMHLMTNIRDVYVGGDIANAPVLSNANQRATINHYQLAQYHGRIAAKNMAGNITELRAVPFFFTSLFGKGLRYSGVGHTKSIYIDGDLEEFKFVAYYMDESDNVIAAASVGRDPIVAQYAELMGQGKKLYKDDIMKAPKPTDWSHMLVERRK